VNDRIVLAPGPAARARGDLLVVPVAAPLGWRGGLGALDRALAGRLRRGAARHGFTAKPDATLLVQTHGAIPAGDVLLVGHDAGDAPRAWYHLGDAVARHGDTPGYRRVAVDLTALAAADAVGAFAEGFALSRYRFTRYRSQPSLRPAVAVTLLVVAATSVRRAALDRARVAAAATRYARDLVNTPAADMTPTHLAAAARPLARSGLRVRCLDRRGIARLQMGALLGVAQGSRQPPRFIEIVYRPNRRATARVALVGKGITFDSGGLNLKTAEAMRTQKRDMAGGATVLAVMQALPALRLPVEVRGYVPAAENMPSGSATRPGDVLRACNGRTIEVLNTDAEGRLVLADALAYAARGRPDYLIDVATLTGAVTTALGSRYAAIMGTDPSLVERLIAAGRDANEQLWQLPLPAEYRRDLDSTVADLKNTGEGGAGTIIGGLFLREFVGDVPWAHIDFSSTAFSSGYPCHPAGASGFGVRTLLRFLGTL
jgi:leucyl aminopeptidase